jgi:3-isopropylmalate/(R)-2-methylmalate dehydratase large subunit
MFDKVWNSRIVLGEEGGPQLLYVDRHILHEGSTPLAFEAMRTKRRPLHHVEAMLGVIDHSIPTSPRVPMVAEPEAVEMMTAFHKNAAEFGVTIYGEHDPRQGVSHVVSPEQGFTLPGIVMVCGDSHTSTHGAFGAYAFGIGTTEVEHVFATGTLWRKKPANMLVWIDGELAPTVTAKDIALTVIGRIGVSGGVGRVIEFAGSAIRALSMEGRMTICNMAIEAGARAGMIAPDETTFAYLKGRTYAPSAEYWDRAVAHWHTLKSDPDAHFDVIEQFDAAKIRPMVTWGTTPEDVVPADGVVPDPAAEASPAKQAAARRALAYMGLTPGTPVSQIPIDRVFIGSCTNGRIEDLRLAAEVVRGRKVAPGVLAQIVPGSSLVKAQAEREGLADIFKTAGFEWRESGCSLCLAMNGDELSEGQRCASTSNRNFEGRQGRGSRTHLVNPAMAAAAAINGRLCADLPARGE